MNTTYKPVDREFLEMLAAAKARGITWMRLAEMTKKPVVELEVIPWREPKAWAKACKYAEKLLQHEALSEMLAQLRVQMNDNVNNARSKSQVANSVVRVIQLQHALRTPKKPKKDKVRATPEPTPTTPSPTVNEPVVTSPSLPVNFPKSASSTKPLATVVAAVLLLLGAFGWWGAAVAQGENPIPKRVVQMEPHDGRSTVDAQLANRAMDLQNPWKNLGFAWHEGPRQSDVGSFALAWRDDGSIRSFWSSIPPSELRTSPFAPSGSESFLTFRLRDDREWG